MSKFLDAFIAQTYTPHGGIEAYEEKSREVLDKAASIHNEWIKEAKEFTNTVHDIREQLNIPTELAEGELNGETIPHPKLANYDHSLEENRLPALREKYDYVEPEPQEPQDAEDFEMSTESYENIDPAEVPDLGDLFGDVFGLS